MLLIRGNNGVKMKKFYFMVANILSFFIAILILMGNAQAFTCQANGTTMSGSGTVTVPVTLTPSVQANENLVVNLGNSIQCKNDAPQQYTDPIRVGTASAYAGALSSFTGSITYNGSTYSFPLASPTPWVPTPNGSYQPWNTILYLSPTGAASGVVIQAGQIFASLSLQKENTSTGGVSQTIIWNLRANNTVTVPTGGCDVSSRNVTVQLPDYPGSASVPLTVHCGSTKALSYYLSGTTADSAASIFTNTSSGSPASGIGVQLSNSSGVLTANKNVSLGNVGTTPVSLGLTASYARTSGQVVAGNVQSVVGVTFVYQ